MKVYKTLRRPLGWGILALGGGVMAWLLYMEWLTPLPPPAITGIASNLPPKTTPPTSQQHDDYSVPAAYPKHLIIPKLAINTNVYALGLTKNGAIDAPQTAWGVGWYDRSSLPGEVGAMLIDGHINDTFNTPGVFYNLHTLQAGDKIQLERGDGQLFSYQVITVEQQPLNEIDMNRLLRPINPDKPGLNLVTCGGSYDNTNKTYRDRILVYAAQT